MERTHDNITFRTTSLTLQSTDNLRWQRAEQRNDLVLPRNADSI